jgi:hypothetical protein
MTSQKKLAALLLVFRLRSLLLAQGGINDDLVPAAITLPLSPEEMDGTAGHRTQNRTIRSVRLGKIVVSYGTGTDAAGNRIVPAELRQVAPAGKNFAYDTILTSSPIPG